MSTHSKAAAKFIADADRTAWHDKALYAVREKRDKMARTVPEWEDLRRMSSEIKRHTLSHLGHYLEEFERNATANGMAVHWAADADEMNATVWRLVQEHGGRNLVKSKSMLSEECGLTPYLPSRATWASGSCSCWSCRPATSCCPPSAYAVRRSASFSNASSAPSTATAIPPT